MDIKAMVNGEEVVLRLSVHVTGPNSVEIYGDDIADLEGNTPFVLMLDVDEARELAKLIKSCG